ncbi:MAG: rhodanese-like domain-containing protein [Bacteroidales bacterium]|nr:rhodanese-like domain-containing protein [Bacteroidales bacterium]
MLARDATVQLVDVRTPEEFAENHLPGAFNIDWRGECFSEMVQQKLDKARPVMVYCRGWRSADAAAEVIAPKVLIPYHFGQTDLRGLPAALPGMDVRLRQMQ